ncbi:MAG: phosphate acyltransferase PlsX [Gemmatimonadaceae bacterium]
MARIALDAMGGDFAPQAPIAGALHAASELGDAHIVQLIGRRAVLEASLTAQLAGELQGLRVHREKIEIIDAADVIEMHDKPSTAVRAKPHSSMVMGIKMQTEGSSDAFVSAGNTGAQMAASTVLLRLHAGLTRPAIATLFPSSRLPVVVLDSGANVDCSAEELLQFARLGAVYAEDVLGRRNPVIGLLSIGEEAEKGNAVVKEAHRLLTQSGLRFQGNVEGRDLPAGATDRGPVDVVVCDGFTGNVVLKFYEAVAPMIFAMVANAAALEEPQMEKARKTLDYSEYGGAPLLGVKGVSIICHGKSSPRAIMNGIKLAAQAVDSRMNEHMGMRLSAVGSAA